MNLWLVFLTGLTTGGFTCLALQGGLLLTAIAAQKEVPPGTSQKDLPAGRQADQATRFRQTVLPTAIFVVSKIAAYTLLGLLLGLFGSFFQLSIKTQMIIQFVVGLFMIATALRMLDVHPLLRRFVLTPPKAIFKFMRQNSKSGSFFSPLILGLMTVFLPCGTTQAMEVQAIGTGNPISGALTMLAFTLGTAPVFFIIGVATTKFSQVIKKYLYPVAAALILLLGLLALDNGLTLAASPFTLKGFWVTATGANMTSYEQSVLSGKTQSATITVYATGYEPNRLKIRANTPTKLTFITKGTQGCSRALVFPTLNVQKILPTTGNTIIDLPPLARGRLPFSCSMGMFGGEIEVI